MMKEFWLSLPVKNIQKSKEFFTKIGFKFNTNLGNPDRSLCLLMGDKNIVVMLFDEAMFEGFTQNDIANTSKGTEVLLSFDAHSKAEVDEVIARVMDAGGISTHVPKEMTGWMYGANFLDLDGHRWNVLYMDMSRR
jgi:predicted lactoylglutathione lyase